MLDQNQIIPCQFVDFEKQLKKELAAVRHLESKIPNYRQTRTPRILWDLDLKQGSGFLPTRRATFRDRVEPGPHLFLRHSEVDKFLKLSKIFDSFPNGHSKEKKSFQNRGQHSLWSSLHWYYSFRSWLFFVQWNLLLNIQLFSFLF